MFDRSINVIIAAYLAFLFWHVISMSWLSLGFPWSSSSDEVAQLAEVIRFANQDFHQRFYDMPGTPLWILGAAEWFIYYLFAGAMQGFQGGTNLFSFQHLQQLFMLMRFNNLVFFLLSGLLLFRIVSKVSNKYAGAAAATLLLMNGAYGITVESVRVEPLSMCFMLAAILVVTESEWRLKWFWAGMLGGAAAACRMHSITATLPLLLLLLFTQTWGRQRTWRPGFRRLASFLAGAFLIVSALSFYWFAVAQSDLRATYPLAYSLLAKASLALFLLMAALILAYFVPKARALVEKLVTRDLLRLFGGLALGSILGTPTIFTEYKRFLYSLNFYQADYRDTMAVHQAFHQKLAASFSFYIQQVAPDKTTLILLGAGCCLILFWARYRSLLPYLLVAVGFFISKPLDLLRAAHHIALWIPFYAMVCSVPFAALGSVVTRQNYARYLAPVAGVLALILLRVAVKDNPAALRLNMVDNLERIHNIERSRNWMQSHTPKGAVVMVAFYCFGPESFYQWMAEAGLEIPAQQDDGNFRLWWGDRAPLKGKHGYACLSTRDTPSMDEWELKRAGDGINPFRDQHFHMLHSFGQGSSQIAVFDFDLR